MAERTQGSRLLHRISVNGTELHYIEQGEGDPVVFVHGGLGDFRTWGPQVKTFVRQYQVVSYSRRGHYPNLWPEGYSVCSMMEHVEDLAELIATLGLGRVHLVANSYGGYVCLFLALRHPEMVRTLALAEPPVHPLLRRLPGGEDLFQQFMESAWWPARRAFVAGNLEEGVRCFLDGAVGVETFDAMPPQVREAMMKNAPELSAATQTDFDVHMPDISCEQLGRIEAPTLLMRGGLSPHKYYLINDELARCIRGAEQELIPDAAHVLHSQNPEAHDRAVLAFLARQSA